MTARVKSGKSDGVVEVTPSGIPIYFQSGEYGKNGKWQDKRLYRIGDPELGKLYTPALLLPFAQEPTPDWREVPSVTKVLDELAKDALTWWGMKIGAEGVAVLHNLGFVRSTTLPGGHQPVLTCPVVIKPDTRKGEKFKPYMDMDQWVVAGREQLTDVLNVQKLTVNHIKDKGGKRGQSVHDAFEQWCKDGIPPDPRMFPPTEQGYIDGLLAFINDVPSFEALGSEILVGSAQWGYAGRYDLRGRTHEPHMVVVHRTPVKGPVYRQLSPGLGLIDLKTSKGIYPSHSRQLEGYEEASVESGYEPTDWRAILHVSAEGDYEFKRSWATFEDFKVVLDLYNSSQRMILAEREDRNRK